MANRGGARIGAGRKPGPKLGSDLARVIAHPSAGPAVMPAPIEVVDLPVDLSTAARAVWVRQAPHATAQRTLTPASAVAFARYCEVVVLERQARKSPAKRGGSNHLGLIKQLNAYELQFMLMPAGKPMTQPVVAAVADPDEAFFAGARGDRG